MGKKPKSKLSDQLRRAIETSDLSRYAISQLTGIDQATLSRFIHSKSGLSMPAIDAVADLLGLRLVSEPTKTKGK